MAYSTEEDITNLELTEAELIQLTDDAGTGEVDDVKVDAAILKADSEIDDYCRGRYSIPFNPVPDVVKFLSATIAAYWLYRRRDDVSPSMLDKYTKALAKLKAISNGAYSIDGVSEKTESSGIASTTEDVVQTFSRTKRDSNGNIISSGSMETW
ncbi:MAG: DUF1320 domain-containing protein [Desulfobacteraceae bacterium]|nr:DUF1320 domain-containing protein [Desulfobacteraceae bacterium]